MTNRRILVLSIVTLVAIVLAQQTAAWWCDQVHGAAIARLDQARSQQLALAQLQRSLDGARHDLDQAALSTTLSGSVPAGALDRGREDLTAAVARLSAPAGSAGERDITGMSAAIGAAFRDWEAFVTEATASPASASAHIAGARRQLQGMATEEVPRFAAWLESAVTAAQADARQAGAAASIAGWVGSLVVVALAALVLLVRSRDQAPAPAPSPVSQPIPRTEPAVAQSAVRAPVRPPAADDAARLQAIGRLAGGVAHDFNNLLTVIKGHMEKLLESAGQSPTRLRLEEVQRAADRAAALTAQLLAFSQRQVLAPRVINLNDIVNDQVSLARPLLDDRIEVVMDLDPGLWAVRADPGQCAQVVMNLVVNARDALMNGGRIVVRTANRPDGWRTVTNRMIVPAVELTVSDNGVGMDDVVRSQVFEPFFTTKSAGPATGLGLSTVHGIVHQSGGDVSVTSAPGKGSTFTVILPAATAETGTDDARRRGGATRIPGILH